MGVVQSEFIQEADSFDVVDSDDNLDTSRVFYFKHHNGEVASGTILDMDGCAFMGRAALKDRFNIAELYDMGQDISNETEEQENEEPEDEKESEEKEAITEQKAETKTEKPKKDQAESKTGIKTTEESESETEQIPEQESKPPSLQKVDAEKPQSPQVSDEKPAQAVTINAGSESTGYSNSAAKVEVKLEQNYDFESVKPFTSEQATGLITATESTSQFIDGAAGSPAGIEPTAKTIPEKPAGSVPQVFGVEEPRPPIPKREPAEDFEQVDYEVNEVSAIADFEIPAEIVELDTANLEVSEVDEGQIISLYESLEKSWDTEALSLDLPYERPLISLPEAESSFIDFSEALTVPAQEVENTIGQISETIQAMEPQAAKEINELLDKIMEMPLKIKTPDSAEISIGSEINDEEIQEELEGLFIELFDSLGIDYTPELLETFVRLTLNHHFEELISQEPEAVADESPPQDIGTHEFLQKLLHGLSTIKKAVQYAYLIGRSAMRLYNFQTG